MPWTAASSSFTLGANSVRFEQTPPRFCGASRFAFARKWETARIVKRSVGSFPDICFEGVVCSASQTATRDGHKKFLPTEQFSWQLVDGQVSQTHKVARFGFNRNAHSSLWGTPNSTGRGWVSNSLCRLEQVLAC